MFENKFAYLASNASQILVATIIIQKTCKDMDSWIPSPEFVAQES